MQMTVIIKIIKRGMWKGNSQSHHLFTWIAVYWCNSNEFEVINAVIQKYMNCRRSPTIEIFTIITFPGVNLGWLAEFDGRSYFGNRILAAGDRFKKKELWLFLKVLNLFLWHLFINLTNTSIGIFVKNFFFYKYINLKFWQNRIKC